MSELTCPVCGGVLHREERSLRCGAGHCYDIARQGYVNLLRSNQSKSKRHGDDKRMVAARTAFLDAGYYAPLRDAVAAAAAEFTAGDADVLDAGCGEGYYTAQVTAAILAVALLSTPFTLWDALGFAAVFAMLVVLSFGGKRHTERLPE